MGLPPASAHRRGKLTNAQRQRLQPLMPSQRPRVERPSLAPRSVINGILWILRTGASWRGLNTMAGGKWSLDASYRWCQGSLWQCILSTLQLIPTANSTRTCSMLMAVLSMLINM